MFHNGSFKERSIKVWYNGSFKERSLKYGIMVPLRKEVLKYGTPKPSLGFLQAFQAAKEAHIQVTTTGVL